MAYQTGTASGQTDLMSKLSTFAQANGYTQNYYNGTNRFLSLSRSADNCYVSFAWDNVNTIAMYQALGFSATYNEQPWNQLDDSGNGNDTLPTNIDRGRQVSRIGTGPFTAYHFFAYTSPTYSIHVVLEFTPGIYRHFGFGFLNKTGIWTGGAWCAGHLWNPGGSFAQYSTPHSAVHSVLMDGYTDQGISSYGIYSDDAGGTLHAEGLPGEDAASKWGISGSPIVEDVDINTDRGGENRIRIGGGCRGGVAISQLGPFLPDLSNGFIPIIPFETFYFRSRYGADGWYYLGRMENVGMIGLQGIDPAEELTVGSDTWIAFPTVRKSDIGGLNQESENQGIIYKKVT